MGTQRHHELSAIKLWSSLLSLGLLTAALAVPMPHRDAIELPMWHASEVRAESAPASRPFRLARHAHYGKLARKMTRLHGESSPLMPGQGSPRSLGLALSLIWGAGT
jgi:hypothetical protein